MAVLFGTGVLLDKKKEMSVRRKHEWLLRKLETAHSAMHSDVTSHNVVLHRSMESIVQTMTLTLFWIS